MFRENENGSSILEVIVAMVILALLVTGLNACVVTLINSNVISKEMSEATSAGYQILDKFRGSDYTSIITSSDQIKGKYVRCWTVTEDSIQKKIDLKVSWPITDKKHSIMLSTIIARP
jgi:Tfp pilus assembly protein PilV